MYNVIFMFKAPSPTQCLFATRPIRKREYCNFIQLISSLKLNSMAFSFLFSFFEPLVKWKVRVCGGRLVWHSYSLFPSSCNESLPQKQKVEANIYIWFYHATTWIPRPTSCKIVLSSVCIEPHPINLLKGWTFLLMPTNFHIAL